MKYFFIAVFTGMIFIIAAELSAATLNAKSYGAIGDGLTDDGPALKSALEALRREKPGSTLLIPSGRYLIKKNETAEKNPGNLIIKGFEDVTITGENNTTLLMGNDELKGLRLLNCKRTTLKDLAVEYSPAPLTQGIIKKWENKRQILVELDAAVPPMPDKKNLKLSLFDQDRMDHAFHRKDVISTELIGERHYRITANMDFEQDPVGHIAVILWRNNSCTAINSENSESCRMENMRVYSGPASAFSSHACSDMVFSGCRVEPRPGSGMVMSTCADGLHVKHNRRGPLVENCYFLGMYDDSINIATSYSCIYRQTEDKLIINGGQYYRIGDTIAIVDMDAGQITKRHKIKAIAFVPYQNGKATELTLDAQPAHVRTAESMKATGSFDQLFNRPSPLPNFCINLDTCGKGAVIRNNVFRNHRARGILLRAPEVSIVNNVFENLRGPAILVGAEIAWLEGGNPENITISGNRFINIGKTNILFTSIGTSHQRIKTGYWNRNIRILNNTFTGYGIPAVEGSAAYGELGSVIGIDNAENITISGNMIAHPSPFAPAVPQVKLENCSDVTISGNRIYCKNNWLQQTEESINVKSTDNTTE